MNLCIAILTNETIALHRASACNHHVAVFLLGHAHQAGIVGQDLKRNARLHDR